MEIHEYLEKKKEIQHGILEYIDDNEINTNYEKNLLDLLNEHNIKNNRQKLRSLFYLIIKISKNHHRSNHFFTKIQNILTHFKQDIKDIFSNSEIFDIFKGNKRILLFLLEEKIFSFDQSTATLLLKKDKFVRANYASYFYEEIKPFIDEELFQRKHQNRQNLKEILENGSEFNRRRQIGNNYCYICKLIRKDLVKEFVEFINKNNYSINSTIVPSLFETNSFLEDKEPTLIEYSAFYGSIQIFKYLCFNNVELTSSLWLYAIHGANPELIHYLEENHVKPYNDSYEKCVIEAIKCHHNDIANYIIDNLIEKKDDENYIWSNAIKSYNYFYFPNDLDNKFAFFYLCKHNHVTFVDLLLRNSKIIINERIILNGLFY